MTTIQYTWDLAIWKLIYSDLDQMIINLIYAYRNSLSERKRKKIEEDIISDCEQAKAQVWYKDTKSMFNDLLS